MSHRLRRCCPPALLLLAVAALAGCGATPSGAAAAPPTPDATPTDAPPTATPSAWQVVHGRHFTISSPPGWSYQTNPPPDRLDGDGGHAERPGRG